MPTPQAPYQPRLYQLGGVTLPQQHCIWGAPAPVRTGAGSAGSMMPARVHASGGRHDQEDERQGGASDGGSTAAAAVSRVKAMLGAGAPNAAGA
jgi:hypothetical protein